MNWRKWYDSFWAVAILLAIAVVIVYSNSFDAAFQFDDEKSIVGNSLLRGMGNFQSLFFWLNVQNRPVSMFTFALNYLAGGYDVWGYHLVNVLIHWLTGILIYAFTIELIKTGKIRYGKQENSGLLAALAAFVFILHPVQTQAVTYIVQRMASLAAMFYLLSCFTYLKARILTNSKGIGIATLALYGAAIVSGYLAIMSKQNAVTLPLAITAIELYFVRNNQGKVNYGFLSAVILTVILGVVFILPYSQVPLQETTQISRTSYFMTQILVVMKYLQLIVYPVGFNIDHHFKLVEAFTVNESLSFLFCFLLGLSIFIFFKRLRLTSFAILWFYLTLSVESSFIPIKDVIAEHRLYLPMVSISILMGYFFKSLIDRNIRYVPYVIGSVFICYGYLTYARNSVWESKISLWEDAVRKSPFKPRPHNNLGHAYLMDNRPDEAKKHFATAVNLNPEFVEALNNLASIYLGEQKFDSALIYLDKTAKVKHDYVPLIVNQGICYRELGEMENSNKMFNRALRLAPNNPDANFNMGYNMEQERKYLRAITYYKRAIEFRPSFADAYFNLGNIYVEKQDFQTALSYYNKAIINNRKHVGAILNSGHIYFLQKKYQEAKDLYNNVITIDPDNIEARKNIQLCNF